MTRFTTAALCTCVVAACSGSSGNSSGSLPPAQLNFCSQLGGHRDTFAYDFDLAMGDPVLASRDGTAIIVNDQ